jgi:hypothetical protein
MAQKLFHLRQGLPRGSQVAASGNGFSLLVEKPPLINSPGRACLERIKKAGVFKNSSLCEAAFHLEDIEQIYKNLYRLTKPKCVRRKELRNYIYFITPLIISSEMFFASIFYKFF